MRAIRSAGIPLLLAVGCNPTPLVALPTPCDARPADNACAVGQATPGADGAADSIADPGDAGSPGDGGE